MKNIVKRIVTSCGGDSLLRTFNRNPRILFWHGVDNILDKQIEAESFSVNQFLKQIEYLKRHYEIIALDEFYVRYQNKQFTNREVVLTFDDGYANNLHIVAPILNKESIPFAVFISTEHIDTGLLFPTSVARIILFASHLHKISIYALGINNYNITTEKAKREVYLTVIKALKTQPIDKVRIIVKELIHNLSVDEFNALTEKYNSVKPMTWQEVKDLNKLGAIIGSHCKYHICCHQNQDQKEIYNQITESKKIIEEKLHTECHYFAYPNGDFSDYSNRIVLEAGYKMGFSTEKYQNIKYIDQKAAIPRIGVPADFETFKIVINRYPKR